jgi:hypothetical protein
MLRVLAALVAVVFAVVFMLLLLFMLTATDLALCSDPEGIKASGEDDCIEGSAAEQALGLVLGFGSAAAAAATVVFGIVYARTARGGGRVVAAAVATPLLALGAMYLLPVSF